MKSRQTTPVEHLPFPLWKRALDVTLILASSVVWCPVFALLVLYIKGVSPGPIFFRQERIGQGGRPFLCFKFRSMKPGAGTKVHEDYLKHLIRSNTPMTKLDEKGDKRLIPMGRLFRSTGLDELPQLINILRGEMSLVGPRPCTPKELQMAGEIYRKRLEVPPGLTGLWQVTGKNRTTFQEMIAMDEFYATHLALSLDLKILIKTIPALVRQVRGQGSQSNSQDPQTVQVIDYTRTDPRE